MNKFRKWFRSKKGQGMVEYALILVLIAIVAITMLRNLGTRVNTTFENVNSSLATAS